MEKPLMTDYHLVDVEHKIPNWWIKIIFLRAAEMTIKSGIRFAVSGFSTTGAMLGLVGFPFNIPLRNDVPDFSNRSLLKEI